MSNVTLGQAHETEITLRKVGATLENFWDPISKSETLARKVIAFVVEAQKRVFKLVSTIQRDMTGLRCIKPVQIKEGEFEFSVVDLLYSGYPDVDSREEIVKRAMGKGVATSLCHLEALLREQDKISEKLRKFILVSSEVWLDKDDDRYVFCLEWIDDRWNLRCHWLKDYCSLSHYRLVVPQVSK